MDIDYTHLLTKTVPQLREMATSNKISIPHSIKKKSDIIGLITTELKEKKCQRYKKISQIGSDSKEGCTWIVRRRGKDYAMKEYKNANKSCDKIEDDVFYQTECAKHGLTPKIIEYSLDPKYIVMEKLDETLFEYMVRNKGKIPVKHQNRIVKILKDLDELEIFHGDPNLTNFMRSKEEDKFYIIDFGMSKDMQSKNNKRKYGETPNKKFMIPGLYMKMKETWQGIQLKGKYLKLEECLDPGVKEDLFKGEGESV